MTRAGGGRWRAICVLIAFLGVLGLLVASGPGWADVAYLAACTFVLIALSVHAVVAKWRSSDLHDVTKHGPLAVYPRSWRRWLMDEPPEEKSAR